MSNYHTLGVLSGIMLAIFLFPVALFYGAGSVAFHRGKPADTFWRGVGLPCRVVTYIVAAGIVAWLFVFAMLIDFQMTMLGVWTLIAAVVAYYWVQRDGRTNGGRAL